MLTTIKKKGAILQLTLLEEKCLHALMSAHAEESLSREQLTQIFAEYLEPVFCYASLFAGVGEIELTRIKIGNFLAINYPAAFFQKFQTQTTVMKRPILAYWLEKQTPLWIEKGSYDHVSSEEEKEEIRIFQLEPMLIHGQRDLSGKISSYYSFRQCGVDSKRALILIKLYMPFLHLLLIKTLKWEYNPSYSAGVALTKREWELVDAIKNGKTNKEIALILGRSPSTIKNQMIGLFEKLEVNTRAEALSKLQKLSETMI